MKTDKNLIKSAGMRALACLALAVAATAADAMPPMGGGRPGGGGGRPSVRQSAPTRQSRPSNARGNSSNRKSSPSRSQNAAPVKSGGSFGSAVNGKQAPAKSGGSFGSAVNGKSGKGASANSPAKAQAGRTRPANHVAPARPADHKPCGRIHPHGHHIGPRHIPIVPPVVVIESYYWTEEVEIDGEYYILYCYPDGTKRFSDGTIYCYF